MYDKSFEVQLAKRLIEGIDTDRERSLRNVNVLIAYCYSKGSTLSLEELKSGLELLRRKGYTDDHGVSLLLTYINDEEVIRLFNELDSDLG